VWSEFESVTIRKVITTHKDHYSTKLLLKKNCRHLEKTGCVKSKLCFTCWPWYKEPKILIVGNINFSLGDGNLLSGILTIRLIVPSSCSSTFSQIAGNCIF
jgi:hypothetical protein